MKDPYFNKITIETTLYHLAPVAYAVSQQIKKVSAEVEILKISRKRDLTRMERWQLPANLQQMTQKELQEEIDPWISLLMSYQSWENRLEELDSLNKKGDDNGKLGKSVGQELDSKTGS